MRNKKLCNEHDNLKKAYKSYNTVIGSILTIICFLTGIFFGQVIQSSFNLNFVITAYILAIFAVILYIASLILNKNIERREKLFYDLPPKEQLLQRNNLTIHIRNDEKGNDIDKFLAGEKILVDDKEHITDGKIYIQIEKE